MKSLFYILFFKLLSFEGFSQINFAQLSGRNFNYPLIGTQYWMDRNLDVTAYRDGTVIPQVTDPTAWGNLTTGAWCYYNNDADNGAIYHKLYNWYAVMGIATAESATPTTAQIAARKQLAPQGWHIPTDAEWTTLSTFLGGDEGGKMKTTGTTDWPSPNTSATNQSGFSGLPGGFRFNDGTFYNVGFNGHWWSATQDGSVSLAWYRYLGYNSGILGRGSWHLRNGYSVRCLRDLKIGDSYAGGILAYILVSGDPGYDANVLHGLIAATSDQSTGIQWYNGSYTTTGATGYSIGTGLSNTNKIITSQGATSTSYAAGLARAYTGGQYTDWYLPSKDEIYKLYLNKTAIGGFENYYYWSSSENGSTSVWFQSFGSSGISTTASKFYNYYVRAIRAF